MKHRILRNTVFVIVMILFVVIGFYLGMSAYYSEGFPAFTWVNSVYCTGKSVTEVNEELLLNVKAPVLTITDKNGQVARLDLSEVNYQESYEVALKGYVNEMSDLSWVEKLSGQRNVELSPDKTWDEEALFELFKNLPMIKEETDKKVDMFITFKDGEYILQDDLKQRLFIELASGYITECILSGRYDINLSEGQCYFDYPIAENVPEETMEMWNKLDEFLSCGIVYDMGDALIPVDRKVTSTFVTVDENGDFLLDEEGNLILNEAALEAFIDSIIAEYDTVGTELAFEATRGETVMVPYKKYGTQINRKAEIQYLKEAFLNNISEEHIPQYKKEGYVRGKDDIGDTYIEIDMTKQKMYCYVDGVCEVETDIVTGNMRRGWDTPAGVNYIYNKQKKRILRGADYASFVNYWMPVNGGIGIHDATWRKEFGGEIYKKNGSHGCINVPKDQMDIIYDLYEVGTPVVMFY